MFAQARWRESRLARPGRGRPLLHGLSLPIKGHISNTHTHTDSGVPRRPAVVKQAVSVNLRQSWLRCPKLHRRIKRTHTVCKHFGNSYPALLLLSPSSYIRLLLWPLGVSPVSVWSGDDFPETPWPKWFNLFSHHLTQRRVNGVTAEVGLCIVLEGGKEKCRSQRQSDMWFALFFLLPRLEFETR